MAPQWFRPKRIGWGLSPATWQGWVATGVMILTVIVLALTVAPGHIVTFFVIFAVVVAAYLALAFLTRGPG